MVCTHLFRNILNFSITQNRTPADSGCLKPLTDSWANSVFKPYSMTEAPALVRLPDRFPQYSGLTPSNLHLARGLSGDKTTQANVNFVSLYKFMCPQAKTHTACRGQCWPRWISGISQSDLKFLRFQRISLIQRIWWFEVGVGQMPSLRKIAQLLGYAFSWIKCWGQWLEQSHFEVTKTVMTPIQLYHGSIFRWFYPGRASVEYLD